MQQQQRNRDERTRRPVHKITIKTEEGIRDRIRHRDTATRDKQPNHHVPIRQRHSEKGHVWQSQTSEISTRPEELKPPPIPTRRDEQHLPSLTITAANMTHTEINRAIEDARHANDELFIRDDNGKVFKNLTSFPKTGEENNFENSELDLISNLSSSTELEADIKHEEENTIRRSKRLTKTNPIVRYNNPVCHDYRKHRRKAELGSNTESNGNGNKQPQLVHTTDSKLTSRIFASSEDQVSIHKQLDHWRDYRHTVEEQNPIGRTSTNSERGNVESADN